ncbi:MAG: hypothetical protein AAF432_08425 [Planctomycetota bacterium]
MKHAQQSRTILPLMVLLMTSLTFASSIDRRPVAERLRALTPNDPMAYFELAEDLVDSPDSERDRELAQQLFGLAGALSPDLLGRSAALALADVEEDPGQKRRLLALADLLAESRPGLQPRSSRARSHVDPAAAYAVATALHEFRNGYGPRAIRALEQVGATELLTTADDALRGGARRFIEDCNLYRGGQRPSLSSGEISSLMHLEAALLAGNDLTWTDELSLRGGVTYIEVDPEQLEQVFDVNADRPFYREGTWRTSATGR